jgi:hypothetical protein
MPATPEKPVKFRFTFHSWPGEGLQAWTKNGQFDGKTLTLGKLSLSADQIIGTGCKGEYVQFLFLDAEVEESAAEKKKAKKKPVDEFDQPLAAEVTPPPQPQLVLRQGLIASSRLTAEANKARWKEQGHPEVYRDQVCPACDSVNFLSNMPESPQLFCTYCDRLTTISPTAEPPAVERELKICEHCGLFSRPQKFTLFYFYFLLVVYGFYWKERECCRNCLRAPAWRMLLTNLLFILGVPWALSQLLRSYLSGKGLKEYRELDRGNLLASKGRPAGALIEYQKILDRVGHSAGVKYNLGLSLIQQSEDRHAILALEASLLDCSNYSPAYEALRPLYEKLQETEKLASLEKRWASVPTDQANKIEIPEAE